MKRTTNFTGALSSASNSMPDVDLPKAATTSSIRSDEQCGMAMPKPIPVRKLSGDAYVDKRISVSGIADLIIQTAREQPADTKHVDGGEQRAASETVFGLAEPARPMVHRNFNQSIARPSNESRNESMHPLKWNQRVNTFTAHRFERTTGVAHVILRKPAPDKICDPTGQTLRHRVLAFCAISANQI